MHTGGYEFIEHTADLGVRATAPTLEGLFEQAARGMYALLGRIVPGPESAEATIDLQAPDVEGLLHDWLGELLWEVDGSRRVFDTFRFERLDDTHLKAFCRGHVYDPAHSERSVEIKAVTYHDLQVRRRDDLYEVTVIFDI